MRAVNILTSLYLHKKRQTSFRAEEQTYQPPEASGVVEQAHSPPQHRSKPAATSDRPRDAIETPRQQETLGERSKPGNGMLPMNDRRPERKKEQPRSSWKTKLSGWTQSYVDEQLKGPVLTDTEQPAPVRHYPASMSSTSEEVPPLCRLSPSKTRADGPDPWAVARSTTDSDSRRSIHSIQSQQLSRPETHLSIQSTTIWPENNFAGFCLGAYHLQVGLIDSAISIHNESTSMTGQSQYYACRSKRCVFEGPAVMYETGWSYDRNLRFMNQLKYRWLFLAKSHVPQTRVKNKLYDFQCLICALSGDKSSKFHGSKKLLEHVGGHAGTQVGGITLLGPLLFGNNSIKQAHDDDFDVNFLPDRASSFLEHSSSSPTSTHTSSDVMSVENYDSLSTFNPKWR